MTLQDKCNAFWPTTESPNLASCGFFQEYFGYTAAPSVFKDDHIIKEAGFLKYYPERLVEDTDRLVLHILTERSARSS